jgi:signal transduction histidine kinase/CheY-like chemotaxis protein
VCYLCRNDEEKWRLLSQFYKVGLEKNEKMMFFQHSTTEEEVLSKLEEGGVEEIRDCLKRGQFQVRFYADVYMTNGKFAPEFMVDRLSAFTHSCVAEGYSALRICGDMSWVTKEQDLTSKLIKYESMLNHAFPENYAALCMYDIRAFKPSDMLQVLATHPQAIINEKLLQNIYYMPPDEYLGSDVDKAMLDRWMHNIEERKSIEEQLIEARNGAEKAAVAKASFLATMSHEIRNPTNGIIGSADMLAHTCVTPEQSEYVSIIQASAKHLYRVVNDVLDFSKLESGKLELSNSPLVVKDLLEDSRRLCQYSIQKNLAVSLRCHADPSCPEVVVGDEMRLRQILVNLIGNACKFTDEGEVVVSVKPVVGPMVIDGKDDKKQAGAKAKADAPFLEFSVSDSGAGITQEDQLKLFTKFMQIDVTQKYAGTGLGLAICKQLVEAMGGTILVKSAMGKGSTFYFRIPIGTLPTPSPSTPPPAPAPSPVPAPSPSPSRTAMSVTLSQDDSVPIALSPELSLPVSVLTILPASFSHAPHAHCRRFDLPIKSVLTCPPAHQDPSALIPPTSPPLPVSPLTPTPPLTHSPNLSSSSTVPTSPPTPVYDFSDDHILVVEDDVTNQKILSHMLKKLKCQVTIASNGLEAIKLAKLNDYSLILTDQYMPVCDGFAAVTQIRAYFAALAAQQPPPACMRRCPFIVVCTGTYEGRLTEVMDDILIKPIRFKTISEIVSRYCTNKAITI